MMKFIGFIPCRAGSERVKDKNTRPFAGYEGGLLELKLRQLNLVPELEKIIVSSNDDKVLSYAESFRDTVDSRVEPRPRPEEYGVSSTSMESFIKDYIAYMEEEGVIMWTHVTHPLVRSELYREAIKAYIDGFAEGHDSLISINEIHKFLWRDGKPFNYDNSLEKWPRSQDIKAVQEINHAIYIMPFSVMREVKDRIGRSPLFYPMSEKDSLDIDWEDQFEMIQDIASAKRSRGLSLL